MDKKCQNCEKIPEDPVLCLVCGTLLCMKEECCQKDGSGEVFKVIFYNNNYNNSNN